MLLVLLLCATTSALYRLVAAGLDDATVRTHCDSDLSCLPVGGVVHVVITALQLVLCACTQLDALESFICVSLWTVCVHHEGRARDRALAVVCGAAWWFSASFSLFASCVVYYNLLSLPFYVSELTAGFGFGWLDRARAAQLVLSFGFWAVMFVGFTQHPQLLDCALLPVAVWYDVDKLGEWLSRTTVRRNDAKFHSQ